MSRGIQKIKAGVVRAGRILYRVQKILLNIFFWIIIAALISTFIMTRPPQIPDRAALVLNPGGKVVEQLSRDPVNRIFTMGEQEVLLKDLLDAVNKAKDDERIQTLVLKTDQMNLSIVDMSKLLDLESALEDFKKTGKKVIAVGDDYDQYKYFLASQANEVYLNPMGSVFLQGFSVFGNFYKEGLEKLKVDVHVFRVGEYKSAVEPFLRNSMSEESKEAYGEILKDLWNIWLKECAAGRGIEVEDLEDYISHFKDSVIQNKGDMAKTALEAKLVDRIAQRDEVRDRLIELVGEDKKNHTFNQIDFKNYLAAVDKKDQVGASGKNVVGIVVAKGEIYNGMRPPGEIGGDSTAELIRNARLDKNIRAIVLRVDSPGGSAFASEIIRRECARAREDGKPVIISMGGLAASGGYMISLASDEIWASPATITGSIGVFGLFPTIDKTLSNFLGVRVDGVGTTSMAGIDRIDRPYNPVLGEITQQGVDRIYDEFITQVANSRNMEKDAVDVIARGRVWSGEAALRIGLVDRLGKLKDALDSAASHAGLGKDYQIQYIKPEMTPKEKIIAALSGRILSFAVAENNFNSRPGLFMKSLGAIAEEAGTITKLNDPKGIYAYCPIIFEQ